MGFGFLVLLVSLVPLSRARDLRQTPPVDRRSAPDALLGEIFNDPTATSQTKDGDNDNDDNISGSGSELWSGSGELPKPSEDSSSQSETVATDSQQELQTTTTQTSTENSANTNKTTDSDSTNIVNNTKTSGDPSETPQGTPQDTNAVNAPPAAHNVPQQSSTATPLASSAVTSQGADSKLPATEDQSQNKVVESEESATTTKDTSTPNADFFPSKTQNYVENFAENPTAGLVSPQTSTEAAANALAFDDNTLYDPTIVKKTDIPNGLDMLANPLVNDTMDMLGVARSSIPEAPIVSQAPAVPKSAPAAIPYRGSFPLQLHKYSPYTKLMKKNMIERAKSGLNQEYAKKSGIPERSVIPGLTDAGGLRPLGINVPQQQQQPQQQQDLSNPQAATQPQAQAPMAGPVPGLFADQPQIAPQAPPAMQPFAPVPTESQPLAQVPAPASLQTPQQALDQAQADVPQASEQSFSPQVAAPSDMQTPGFENTAAAFPMNASMNSPMFPSAPETIGIPPQGAQAVPVYKGLTPKKPFIEEDQCDDQFDTCPEMAKNDYCTKFPDLMKIQCRKSCHFCVHTVHTEDSSSGSSSGNDEYYSESGSDSYYESDEASGSGSSDWSESSEEDDDPLYKKSGIPRPIHQVLMAKFSGDSGSASEASGVEASSDSADDVLQTSGSGEAASGSQKKDEVSVNMAASGSGEAAVTATSASAAEIGSGSGSLAEDLATGTVSKANEKHSTIPQPPRPQQESVYPKIDLKEIAKAVDLYRGVALKMLGEALEGAAQEKEEELSKKSQIPLPPADAILQRMGFPVGEDYGAKRNMIPNGMVPNYGMMGYGNNGYAYNYPNPAGNAPLADFYNQYQQQPNMARSEIMASPMEEEPQSDDEGAAQDEQPEEIQPVAPTAEPVPESEQVQQQENTTAEVTKEPEKQDKPEPAQNKTNNNMRKSEIADPFEYVRNMGKGASMEPIRSLAAASATSMSHSNPLVLWKSSQLEALSALAKKKSTIPEPESETAMPAFTTSEAQAMQSAFQAPEQQFRSDIPDGMNPFIQQNTTSEMPDVTGQTAPMPAPVFPQNTPQSEAWTQNSGDNLAARSQIQGLVEPSLGQQSQQQEGLLARLRPQQSNVSSADFKNAIPQGSMGSSFREVSSRAPIAGSFPLTLRKMVPGMAQKKDELYKQVQAEINKDSVPSSSVDFVANQKINNPVISNPVPQPAQMAPAVTRSDFLKAVNPISGNLINKAMLSGVTGAANSKGTNAAASSADFIASQKISNPVINNPVPQPAQMTPGVTRSDFLPGDQSWKELPVSPISNNLVSKQAAQMTPGVTRSDFLPSDQSWREPPMNPATDNLDNKAKASDRTLSDITSSVSSEGMNGGDSSSSDNTDQAADLINEALTGPSTLADDMHSSNPLIGSLDSKITTSLGNPDDTASIEPSDSFSSPEVEISGKIPDGDTANGATRAQVSHKAGDKSSAFNLPPLHHDNKLAENLPPLNHGMELAGALPPLNHNMDSISSLPPLNHAKEEAAGLPPLMHGIEQAGNLPPLNHGSDALQSFNSLPPLNHGKEQAGILPPLNHFIENNGLPPLNHASEGAGNLPPLVHSVEQASHAPSENFEKQASQNVDAFSSFMSQVENAAPLNNNGEMVQSYIGKPPQSPPLEHAYPLNHAHEALLPSIKQLPPLNHNELVSVEASRYTGSDGGDLPSQGQTRSKSPPPLYPFTIPPEGEQENQGYHADKGNTNYHEASKASSQASARGWFPAAKPAIQNYGSEPPISRQYFPEGGQPYPIPLPPEGSQNDPISADSTGQTPAAGRQFTPYPLPYPVPLPPEGNPNDPISRDPTSNARPFDSQLLEDPGPFPSAQLAAGWKKANTRPANPSTEANVNIPSHKQIGKKNLIRPKPDLQCGAGWTGALGDFGSFCYKEIFERKSWDNARHSCRSFGGDLFSVTNAYEQRFLENFTNIESWLGYRDKSRDGTWSWSDSSLSVFTNWDSSVKNDHGNGKDCVLLNSQEGKWKDASCSKSHAYLCKKKAEDCSKGWKKLTLNTVNGCYKLFKEPKSWEQSLVSCMDQDASLASILSDDEQTMISQVYSKHDFWVGYNDIDNEGDWLWSDRTTSSYTNWDDKSPNNGGISCAIVTTAGKWHDEPCQSQFSFICKKPSPKGPHHPLNDATLTKEVEKLVSNQSLLNPDLDTTVTIFGRHSVTPQYFWTVQKIFNNRIHGSNPIAAHGDIKSVDGGIQLNGADSWLDAGDFYGQCLGDPDLCIKGFSFALQLNFDDDALSYKDKRYILDSSGSSRGVAIYIQNGSLFYKVVASTKEWELSTELVTNEWQDIVLTWKKEEGLMLYVNGAFRDSLKDGKITNPVPNKQARLTIGRKSGNQPFKYTRMYISSLYAFTRFLAPEDVPYVFTLDDTVVPRYMWLLPHVTGNMLPGSPDIEVNGLVRAVDGGVHLDGKDSFLKVGNFDSKCLHDPSKCPNGLSLSCKLKFNRVVRTYKEPHYILDSGGHQKGIRGLSSYLLNNNLYFSVALSTDEDTLTWTVRTSIFTVRWQRVVLSWSLSQGLWLYTDSQFRGWTKTPKSVPRDVVAESSDFIVGRKNVGPDDSPAEFSIGSLAVFPRFLEKKDVEKVFGGKKMPYPGLIREVWKELPGKSITKLKDDPYYPNDPSLIEIIENFDSPFDISKDYGSRVKGYLVAPETGNYTFYMSGSQSGELWMSSTESQQNLTKLVSLDQPTGHNQWNKYAGQISKSATLEAGKYYYITGLQKGTESTDSLSAGVRLPSGRFMRPITKEILQWRMPGDPFAGVIRELWQDIPGYRIMDLTSNPNFPNNPSSIEVLDKFDAPHNVDDNYGSRIRGFFKAPESGLYRFFLAADTTGELWLSSDETEKNLKKVVAINGWTAHNEWLKFPEQKSERIHLKKGKYYYLEAYQKADKLADCVSVAVELPSGHFEGPIKRVHLSWRLPDGKTGPGPSSEEEAIPKPVGLYPLTKAFGGKDAGPNNENGVLSNVELTTGPDDAEGGAYEFKGTADSFVEIPNDGKLDTQNSMTILASIFPTGSGGPILNYKTNGWGVHLWQFESTELFVRFVHRNGIFHKPLASRVLQLNEWNQVGATYDNTTGVAQLWHNGKMVKSRNIGQIKLATQYPIRIGARDGDERRYAGKISCLQIYGKALDEQQIGNLKSCPVQAIAPEEDEAESGDGSGSGAWDTPDTDSTAVSFSHNVGKYDRDEEADDEIQGSESTSGNKCEPQPCENSGKCVRDSKRLDGYRCECTSDFTGRNCQVSKPDAENPIVKRAKIPKPELKKGSEDYQKNASSLNVIENVPEEKKEDVLLLFQKVGCFKDEPVKHDLPSKATVKSVTQEDCVRSCALEEKGYSYFGLQSADQCYCGHRYGKYGKADDSLCNMPCKGNDKENCGGNSTNMVYFFGLGTNYTINTFTGDVDGADTDAKVYITLYGEKGDSGFRKIDNKHFEKGKKATNTLVLPDLGKLRQVRILHDNSGASPSWFLDKLTVTDENGREYKFPCKEWLSETQGGGKTERLLRLKHS